MAKQAKERDPQEITSRAVKALVKGISERFDAIESAKMTYANRAGREREAMAKLYESAAYEGIPQKVAKLHVKIVRHTEMIKGWMAELEAIDQATARKMAKAHDNKAVLLLWNDLPTLKVPAKAAKEAAFKAEKANGKTKGATGADIAEADDKAAQEAAPPTETAEENHPLH